MSNQDFDPEDRRPLKSRSVRVFQQIAFALNRANVSPNMISVTSMVFALGTFAALFATRYADDWALRLLWIAGAIGIQLRLLANMLDGMVAVDSGKTSPGGAIYNEVPDRVADPLILVGAGFAVASDVHLGYVAAIMAMLVAYIRAVGAHAGAGQQFCGPMAKPQRMFLLTIACLYNAMSPVAWQPVHGESGWGVMAVVLAIVIVGGAMTATRRLHRIGTALRALNEIDACDDDDNHIESNEGNAA